MAVINFANREISCKIVYFGGAEAGCNTNLRNLHTQLEPAASSLHRFAAPDNHEASWFFEHVPPDDELRGFRLKYRVFSLPGGIDVAEHRDEVLREADGIVFVADARMSAGPENEAALLALEEALVAMGLELSGLPVVIQVNHTDHPDAHDPARVIRPLNPYGFPVHNAAAKLGKGVRETYDSLLDQIRTGLLDTFAGTTASIVLRANRDDAFDDPMVMHARLSHHTGASGTPVSMNNTEYVEPEDEIEVPYLPRDLVGSKPLRLLDAHLEEQTVIVDLELETKGLDKVALRVRMPTTAPERSTLTPVPNHSLSGSPSSPIAGVTDHLPDVIDFSGEPVQDDDFPSVIYGAAGLVGGLVVGLLVGFLLFH